MIEQQEIVEAEPEPDLAPSPDEPPSDIGTGLTGGDGTDGFGLTSGSGAGGSGRIGGSGQRSGGRFDRQALAIQNTLATALRQNERTRKASFSGKISVWADSGGRITRVSLDGSTGNSSADQALRQDLLGLRLPDVSGMPMPIHIRLSGRKSSS